ncbi:ectoine/hydroxyectoine ABC transporter permease subunit EhuD [Microbacterium karelineae]|uniref:ectoine/hydroxyectoine ABC transporter permease subunit EhuD n=1 Tax=Microbacterium karelineae TaxID=2654283 RepID=UPI0012E9E1F8|nr:ectoine/hydroxyectoine ABC transporter permease subunit EhuD [Microbacterium karelineae]
MIDTTPWKWEHVWAALPDMLYAFVTVTLFVTILGSVIAAVLGLGIALLRKTVPGTVSAVITFVVDFIRMTPLVIQLLFPYFAFPHLDPLMIGVVVFGIHYASYMAEVYRAGIDAVPKGQWEAATALSMSRRRTWTAVVVPQAIRSTLPALGNYVISMFKETPFLTAITVIDMLGAAMTYGGQHFRSIEVVTLAGILFLIASYPTSLLIGRLEKRLAY